MLETRELEISDARQLMSALFGGTYEPHLDQETIDGVLAQPNYELFTVQTGGRTVAMTSLYTVRLLSRHLNTPLCDCVFLS